MQQAVSQKPSWSVPAVLTFNLHLPSNCMDWSWNWSLKKSLLVWSPEDERQSQPRLKTEGQNWVMDYSLMVHFRIRLRIRRVLVQIQALAEGMCVCL